MRRHRGLLSVVGLGVLLACGGAATEEPEPPAAPPPPGSCCPKTARFPDAGDGPVRGHKERVLVDPDGRFSACEYATETEAVYGWMLCDRDERVHKAQGWRPVGFNAYGWLVLNQAAADDDLAIIGLNVRKGQFTKSGEEILSTRIGTRTEVATKVNGKHVCLDSGKWVPIPDAGDAGRDPQERCP